MTIKKTRAQLKELFKQGAKPSGTDFSDLIESVLNAVDDGLERPAGTESPLTIKARGKDENILDIYAGEELTLRTSQRSLDEERSGLHLKSPANDSRLFLESDAGNLGLGTDNPTAKLHIRQMEAVDALRVDDEENDSTPLVVNSEGKVGIGTDSPQAPLTIAGGDKYMFPDANMHITSQSILFGGTNNGREQSSASITAGIHSADSLCIVGMSDAQKNNRRIKMWAEGGLTVHGPIEVSKDQNIASYFGRAAVGFCGHGDYAAFAHSDQNSIGGYALLQSPTGTTFINAAPNQNIYFRNNNVYEAMILYPEGRLSVTGSIEVSKDRDTTSYFGRAAVGHGGYDDFASFYHHAAGSYAMMHNRDGITYLNSATDRNIYFRIGDLDRMVLCSDKHLRIYGPLSVIDGDIYYRQLSKLDVAENYTATVRCVDFLIKHSANTDNPGRALVNTKDSLIINYGSDWSKTCIGSDTVVNGRLTVKKYFKAGEGADGLVLQTGWRRIAENAGDHKRASAEFTLRDEISGGGHSSLTFRVGSSFNDAGGMSFTLLNHSRFAAPTFMKIRVLQKGIYEPQYLEVYVNRTGPMNFSIYDNLSSHGWSPVGWTPGEVPAGYAAREFDVDNLFAAGDYTNRLTVSRGGDLTVSGSIRASAGQDIASYLGWAATGYCGHSANATFAHRDQNNTKGYALLQNAAGVTVLNSASGHAIYFRNNDVDKMWLNPDGRLVVNETIEVSKGQPKTSYIGKAAIGVPAHASHAVFSHLDMSSEKTYALLQSPDGATFINAAAGKNITFRNNDDDKMSLDNTGKLTVYGDINYNKLTKLDVQNEFFAYVGCADFCIGHSTRRGTPGRALVDMTDYLLLNCGPDWAKTRIGGYVGICGSDPEAPLTIAGGGKKNYPNANMHISDDCILFGGPNAGGQTDSAQISAGRHRENSLCIVGMSGPTDDHINIINRKINMWAEGGLTISGPIIFDDAYKPILIRAYGGLGDNPNYNTGVSTAEWSAAIIGVALSSDGTSRGQYHYMYQNGGTWWIRGDVMGPYDNMSFQVMFIRKGLVNDERVH